MKQHRITIKGNRLLFCSTKGTAINDLGGAVKEIKRKNSEALLQEKKLEGLKKFLEKPSPGNNKLKKFGQASLRKIFLERLFRGKKLERLLRRKNKLISESSSAPPRSLMVDP